MDDALDLLGTGWAFPPAFDRRRCNAVTASGVTDIEESLRILFGTSPGERIMHPSYGCGLRRLVFEPMNTSTLTEIRSLIEKAVLFFEARITLDTVSFDTAALLDGVLRIRLDYRLRTSNSPHNFVYPLYLREGEAVSGATP
ncbi:GPW/gp25 family protein [Roseateles asaccharophilus]|uniref:Phage baseplate assembly protein W n=1 Tax=Roseateles asaccharophilus TaxID=582607 RepID=A0ABU2ABL3_9BURK|nr:GPW/gp25 family protein [Roseateles asaccharophilus]MDR7334592.1 phage baseplate assembly protein W [Roseateles asaccharophilus]